MSNIDDFKVELKALLKKYNADIIANCDKFSETHGITGERMVVYLKNRHTGSAYTVEQLSDSWEIGAGDL